MTPAQHGRAVAMDIAMALVPITGTMGGRKRGEHFAAMTTAPPADDFPDAVRMNDHQGSTWTEIVGVEKVRDMRIGVTGGGTKRVSAASFTESKDAGHDFQNGAHSANPRVGRRARTNRTIASASAAVAIPVIWYQRI